jgi:hypothetical protein
MSVHVLTLRFTRAMLSSLTVHLRRDCNAAIRCGTKLWYLGYHSGVAKDSGYWHERETLSVGDATPSNAAPHPRRTDTSNSFCDVSCGVHVLHAWWHDGPAVVIQSCFMLTFVRCVPLLGICETECASPTALIAAAVYSGARQYNCHINPLTPELNPSAQRYLTRFFTGDFASWTVHAPRH